MCAATCLTDIIATTAITTASRRHIRRKKCRQSDNRPHYICYPAHIFISLTPKNRESLIGKVKQRGLVGLSFIICRDISQPPRIILSRIIYRLRHCGRFRLGGDIFYFSKRRPSQLREMSDMTQTLARIRDANEFMVAEDTKQRVQASVALAIKRINPQGVGRVNADKAGNKGYTRQMFTPGMVTELAAGDEVQLINPQGQASDASTYIKLLQRLVSSGQGLSYEAVARDMSGSTYSSTR